MFLTITKSPFSNNISPCPSFKFKSLSILNFITIDFLLLVSRTSGSFMVLINSIESVDAVSVNPFALEMRSLSVIFSINSYFPGNFTAPDIVTD